MAREPGSGWFATAAAALVALGCAGPPGPAAAPRPGSAGPRVVPSLAAHSAEFEPRLYRLGPRVHQAVGFGGANSTLIEGEDGVIVVDTTESCRSAEAVRSEFRGITEKPVAAIIYTHFHADHVGGARAFVAPERRAHIEIWSHRSTPELMRRVGKVRTAIRGRGALFAGRFLPYGEEGVVNLGLALRIPWDGIGGGALLPNRFVDERSDLEISGVRMRLVHAPGETDDQLFVWLPDDRILLTGDNLYRAFPNLYTIRGTPYRDVESWYRSLDEMRALRPRALALGHTRPVSGEAEAMEALTAYRDAIQFVHDQTIRGINLGLTPDELVDSVVLPPHLARHPFLQEHYGRVEWAVRSIFSGHLGWFDGDAATLSPVSPQERARGLVSLAGGRGALLRAAAEALHRDRPAWAAELAAHLVRLDPDDADAMRVEAEALRLLGYRSSAASGRNYYLSQAKLLERGNTRAWKLHRADDTLLRILPLKDVMAALPLRLDPARSVSADFVLTVVLVDLGDAYSVHVRRGVAELRAFARGDADVSVRTSGEVWRQLLLGARSLDGALRSGELALVGARSDLEAFLGFFDAIGPGPEEALR